METIEKAKQCPFCKTTDLYFYPDGDMEGHDIMGKHEPGCPMDTFGYETEGQALEAWNTRAIDAKQLREFGQFLMDKYLRRYRLDVDNELNKYLELKEPASQSDQKRS